MKRVLLWSMAIQLVLSISAIAQVRVRATAPEGITGVWRGNDGGIYQVRQRDDLIWWYGRSGDGGRAWQNVFYGRRNADGTIDGSWGDLPPAAVRSSGVLRLRIDSLTQFSRLDATGGFGGSVWMRSEDNGAAPTACRSADLGVVIPGMESGEFLKTPPGQRYTQQAAPMLPQSFQLALGRYESALDKAMRALAGDPAVEEYKAKVEPKCTGDLQIMQCRLEAIDQMLR